MTKRGRSLRRTCTLQSIAMTKRGYREDKTSVIASPRCWNYKQAGTARRGRGDLPDCSTGRQRALWVSLRKLAMTKNRGSFRRRARTKHPSSRAPAAVITSKQELQVGGVAICLKSNSKIFRCGLCPSGYRGGCIRRCEGAPATAAISLPAITRMFWVKEA